MIMHRVLNVVTFLLCAVLVLGQMYVDPALKPGKWEDGDAVREILFKKFIKKYERKYRPDSNDGKYYARFNVFKQNLKYVEQMNKRDNGSAVYGITQFMDFTPDEFKQMNGFRSNMPLPKKKLEVIETGDEPASFDWKDHGAVTEVKNQGQCGSCWAFSTTGNIEGQWFIKKKKLVSLSEQELLDCDTTDLACNGGLPSQAYASIEKLGGLETESDYPYDARKESCTFNSSKVAVKISDSASLPQDEEKMKAWLYKNGPISIGINANMMQFYWGGVSHPWKIFCNPKKLDHGVLITGYGVTGDGTPYWVIKNSWGPSWGEHGYYRIYRGDGSCGLNQMATTAIIN